MILAYADCAPESLLCYTFGGHYRESMDVKLAREVAGICQQPFQTITISGEFLKDFPTLAEKTVFLTDGAMDVGGASELYANRLARQVAPVRLTGNYAQEVLRSSIAFKPVPFLKSVLNGDFGLLVDKAGTTYHDELQGHPLSFVAFKQVPWHHFSRLSLELSQLTLRSPYLDNDLVALAYRAPNDPTLNREMQLRLIAEGNPALGRLRSDRDLLFRPIPLITNIKHLYQEVMAKAEYAYDYGMPQWLSKLDHKIKQLSYRTAFFR